MITTANTIETVTDIDVNGNSIECAKLTISDTSIPFALTNIMTVGKDYTFSLYLKNPNSSSIVVAGKELTSSASWTRQCTSFTSTKTYLSILFQETGTYYFYNMQLETGKICSDWTPNPTDVDDDIENATSIARQTADKFEWIVKGESTSSNLVLTDNALTAIANNINLTGKVTFNCLNNDTQNKITNANNWVTSNGQNAQNLYSMVSKWAADAISDTTEINGGWLKTNTITADKIAADAIKSKNYISTGGTEGSFLNLADGSFISQYLNWDKNGNLLASSGTIGGWEITDTCLRHIDDDIKSLILSHGTPYACDDWCGAYACQNSGGHTKLIGDGMMTLYRSWHKIFSTSLTDLNNNMLSHNEVASTVITEKGMFCDFSQYVPSKSNYSAEDESQLHNYTAETRYLGNEIRFKKTYTDFGETSYTDLVITSSIKPTYEGLNIESNSQIAFNPTRTSVFTTSDPSKYNAIETVGDVVVTGKIHAISGSNKIQLNANDNGSIELYGNTPFIDFHNGCSDVDYTSRIIANSSGELTVCGKLRCDSNIISNNDLIANSWIYAGASAHYTWQNQMDAYLSCGYYSGGNNIYYYANYHAFYVNSDSGSGMFYVTTNGCSCRKGFSNSSDERIKQNFSHFDGNFINTYMSLEPVKYQFKNDTNDKYHFGFKAQQTEKVLNHYGESYNEEYGLCATHAIDPEKAEKLYGVKDMHEEYTLAYDELIAPTTYMVQHTYKELERVKKEKADLEARLAAIEAKLGL